MTHSTQEAPKALRLVFELARADNPRLYDELVGFPQGVKRVNRLRVLAYDGLLSQYGVFAQGALGVTSPEVRGEVPAETAGVTNDVFGPSLAE